MAHIQSSVKYALGLAAVGAVLKYYASSSSSLSSDKKAATQNIGDYALYTGLVFAALFQLT